jgi:iron complex transport system substrate-binding protein
VWRVPRSWRHRRHRRLRPFSRFRVPPDDIIFLAALDAKGELDPAVANNEVFQSLATVRGGRVVYWPGPATINTNFDGGAFSSAFSIGGPLGIRYSLDHLVALLNEGVDT